MYSYPAQTHSLLTQFHPSVSSPRYNKKKNHTLHLTRAALSSKIPINHLLHQHRPLFLRTPLRRLHQPYHRRRIRRSDGDVAVTGHGVGELAVDGFVGCGFCGLRCGVGVGGQGAVREGCEDACGC